MDQNETLREAQHPQGEKSIQEHYESVEVITMLQPIVTMLAAQEERLSKKIDQQEIRMSQKIGDVHSDVKRINGSVAQAHKDIADFKHDCALRGEKCAATLTNIKNANWIIERFSEMSKRPKTAVVVFLLFVVTTQIIVLEATEKDWLGKIWDYVRLIF